MGEATGISRRRPPHKADPSEDPAPPMPPDVEETIVENLAAMLVADYLREQAGATEGPPTVGSPRGTNRERPARRRNGR